MGETMLPPMWSPEDRRQSLVEAALQSGAYSRPGGQLNMRWLKEDVVQLEKFISEATSAS